MSFRTIVINKQSKLDYELNYLVVKNDEVKKILLNEITMIIVQNTTSTITSYLISKLAENKIKIIFCDDKKNPCCELVNYYNNYSNYIRIKKQIAWNRDRKDLLWKKIIESKLKNSSKLLKFNFIDDGNIFEEYINSVEIGDKTNREGHGAKVYFNLLFGKSFSRGQDCLTNKYLNYGYAIIVSYINREIKSCGYLTELGIHHIGETNPFNLSYDIVEPFRTLIDSFVVNNKVNEENYRKIYQDVLSYKVTFDEKEMFLDNALHLFILNIFSFLNEETDSINFVDYEF